MRTANVLAETTIATEFKHRDWHVVPNATNPNCFSLEETTTGKVLGTLVLPESGDTTLLNLIASAPELQDIAEMYRDTMTGNETEKSMVFSIVTEVLHRTQ